MSRQLVVVHHLCRGGGHAFVNWLLTASEVSAHSNSQPADGVRRKISYVHRRGSPKANKKDGMIHRSDDPTEPMFTHITPVPLLTINYEDKGEFPIMDQRIQDRFWRMDKIQQVILLRSFYNNMASRVKVLENRSSFTPIAYTPEKIDLWIEMARWFLEPRDAIPVKYDIWTIGSAQRHNLARKKLGLETDDLHPEGHVSIEGSGSSFTKTRYTPISDVNHRWKQVQLPQEVLDNEEARELNQLIFHWTLNKEGQLIQ